jgi:hypothetical protein
VNNSYTTIPNEYTSAYSERKREREMSSYSHEVRNVELVGQVFKQKDESVLFECRLLL